MTPSSPARRGTRRTLAAVAAAAVGGSLALTAVGPSATAAEKAPEPLQILLTNDDGWDAPGISAVYDALTEAGHEVTVVAPATNQSGSGARATFGGTLQVAQPEPGKYSVAGTLRTPPSSVSPPSSPTRHPTW